MFQNLISAANECYKSGDYEESVELYLNAIKIEINSAQSYMNRAGAYTASKRHYLALFDLIQAEYLNNGSYFRIASLLTQRKGDTFYSLKIRKESYDAYSKCEESLVAKKLSKVS